jgi:hypothetical protein
MTAEKITFDYLVERLGAKDAPQSDGLWLLRLFIEDYARNLSRDRPRVSELNKSMTDIRANVLLLARRAAALDQNLEPLPEPGIDGEIDSLRAATQDMLVHLDNYCGALDRVLTTLGKDAGGRTSAAARLAKGSPRRRFVRNLAPIWEAFKGPPTGTEGGEFHKFVCACHEVATGKEDHGFADDVKAIAKEHRVRFVRKDKVGYLPQNS